MTKQDLQRKLRANYNRDTWKEVLLEMFPEADMFAQDSAVIFTRKEQEDLAKNIVQYGEVDLEDDKLIFVEVELKKGSVNIARNRVGLRRLVDSEVISGVKDGAIITYYQPETDEWRITFYSERYGWDEDGNTIKEETHPKRYTYVVGPSESCKTAVGQLIKVVQKGGENTLEHVLKAFSVQKVSKEFFKEYKEQYDKFVGYLTGKIWTKSGVKDVGDRISQFQFYFKATTDHEKEARDFVKKLLGRIVFLYFVQKKQWLGADSTEFKDGKPDFIYALFKQVPDGEKDQFYSQWLTKLFFDTLNRDNDHAFDMPNGSTLYIPFLNGGLFEKDETDHNTESLPLPGELFSNPEDTESPNTRGFLDFLSAYNFTIHEDSPGDHTIAVDPEMLGHIFENLLEDNKDKGAYYTPKPIVHYMCQESLIEYLLTELTAEEADDSEKEELRGHLEDLIKKQEAGELVGFTEPILKSLKEVKVCDPAIGSGAFPMGILQEIYQAVETLHHLSPDNVRAIWKLPDDDWHPAEVKKQIIQNSIYGVDIEKGAVDIARLRFWLSLIVDEEEPTPLPNLDYKIVVGDSLVSKVILNGEEKVVELNWDITHDVPSLRPHVQNLNKALRSIVKKQKKFFEADNEKKKELREEIKQLKIDALIHQLKYDREYYGIKVEYKGNAFPTPAEIEHNTERKLTIAEFTKTITELEQIKDDSAIEFQHFEWKLDFPEILNDQVTKDHGFDIVIANPPYLGEKGNKEVFRKIKRGFLGKYYKSKMDLFYFFFHLAIENAKSHGLITFITTNYYVTADGALTLRKELRENCQPLRMVNFGEFKIFDSARGQHNLIALFKKGELHEICSIISVDRNNDSSISILNTILEGEDEKTNYFTSQNIFSGDNHFIRISNSSKSTTFEILEKIKDTGSKLSSYFEVNSGCDITLSSIRPKHLKDFPDHNYSKGEGVFVLSQSEIDILFQELNNFEKSLIKPFIKNSDIGAYTYNYSNSKLLYIDWEVDEKDIPNLVNHLIKFKPIIDDQIERYDEKNWPWYSLHRPREIDIFKNDNKLIVPYRSKSNDFAYSNEPVFSSRDVFYLTPKSLFDVKLVLGLLNSKLIYLWLFHRGKRKGDTLELYATPLSDIPIHVPDNDPGIADLVDQILTQKEANPEADTTDLEQKIDTLVYKLYNLTWEEVQVVDPEFGLSEEEYEAVGEEE